MKSGSYFSDDEVFYLPQVPDTPIADGGHGHKVTFRSPVVRPRSVSSTPCLVPQPVSFDLSIIPDTETSGKDMDSNSEVRPKTPHQEVERMRQDAAIALHSFQLRNLEKSVNPKFRNSRVDIQPMPCLSSVHGLKM